jgi:hypothetical protein
MELDAVREALRKEPFQPFVLRLTDGRELLISQLGSLAVMPGRVVFVSPGDDSITIIPAAEIAAVEFCRAIQGPRRQQVKQGFSAQRNVQHQSVGSSLIEGKAMQINAIREALHMQPFRPFTLRLADGRDLPVPHPDFVAILGRTAVIASPQLDDSYSIVEPLLIVSIEYVNSSAQPASGTNTGGNS